MHFKAVISTSLLTGAALATTDRHNCHIHDLGGGLTSLNLAYSNVPSESQGSICGSFNIKLNGQRGAYGAVICNTLQAPNGTYTFGVQFPSLGAPDGLSAANCATYIFEKTIETGPYHTTNESDCYSVDGNSPLKRDLKRHGLAINRLQIRADRSHSRILAIGEKFAFASANAVLNFLGLFKYELTVSSLRVAPTASLGVKNNIQANFTLYDAFIPVATSLQETVQTKVLVFIPGITIINNGKTLLPEVYFYIASEVEQQKLQQLTAADWKSTLDAMIAKGLSNKVIPGGSVSAYFNHGKVLALDLTITFKLAPGLPSNLPRPPLGGFTLP
jgi:hypothetical protein